MNLRQGHTRAFVRLDKRDNGEPMQLIKALAAFYQTLFSRDCEHKQIQPTSGKGCGSAFCPDCGYKIQVMWTLCRCRTCGSKRYPKLGADGRISTLYKYCQHCGQADYQIIKKDKINVHEMSYALLTREIDYAEERLFKPKTTTNPFEGVKGLDIVEGEVLRSEQTYYTRGKAW